MGDLQLPISPKKVTVKIAGQNKEITLADGTNTNILNSPKLAEVTFQAILPSVQYAFAEPLVPITDFTTQFNEWMTAKKPFQFIMVREFPDGTPMFDTNMTVTLETVEYTDAADEGFDLIADIGLKRYVKPETTRAKLAATSSGSAAVYQIKTPARLDTREYPTTYTVKAGETLWEICQRELGEGAVWNTVAHNNKISDPNNIPAGTVLKLW